MYKVLGLAAVSLFTKRPCRDVVPNPSQTRVNQLWPTAIRNWLPPICNGIRTGIRTRSRRARDISRFHSIPAWQPKKRIIKSEPKYPESEGWIARLAIAQGHLHSLNPISLALQDQGRLQLEDWEKNRPIKSSEYDKGSSQQCLVGLYFKTLCQSKILWN